MSNRPENPKKFHLQDGDTVGFSDGGERVPIVRPAVDETPQDNQDEPTDNLTLADIFTLLLYAAKDDREIAVRAKMLGYLAKCEYAPRTLEQLGAKFGCSKQAAGKRLTTFRKKASQILALRHRRVDGAAIDE